MGAWMGKTYKDVWLTEQEIGDLIWANWEEFFGGNFSDLTRRVRELPINGGRVDFATFAKNTNPANNFIELFELKITASISSIIQILTYKQDLDEVLRQAFYESEEFKEVHMYSPQINMNLVARYFDAQILQICSEIGIVLWRVNVISKTKISIEPLYEEHSKPVYVHPEQIKNLVTFFTSKRET